MSAINTDFDAKVQACSLYGWVATPCIWYASEWSVVWNPTEAQNTISALATRVIKSVGLLLISPVFAVLGIALVGLGKIAEARLPRKESKPLEASGPPPPTVSASLSGYVSYSKGDLLVGYQALWKTLDMKEGAGPLRESLKEKLKLFSPKEDLKKDIDLICIQNTLTYLDECDQRALHGQGPAIGTQWYPFVTAKDPSNPALGVIPSGGADVLKVYADGDCLFHSFFAHMILLGQEIYPEIRDRTKKVQALRNRIADYLTHHLENAQKNGQPLPTNAHHGKKPFAEFNALEHLHDSLKSYIARRTLEIEEALASIDTVEIPHMKGQALKDAHHNRAELVRELQSLPSFSLTDYIAKVRELKFHGGYAEIYALSRCFLVQIEVKRLLRCDRSRWQFLDAFTARFGDTSWKSKITLIHTDDPYDAELSVVDHPAQAHCLLD